MNISTTVKEHLNETILVVDDVEESRYVKARTLQRAGYSVREAAGGLDAIRLAAAGVELVLLDVRMPDIDGFEVATRLKSDARTAGIPVLLLTASASDLDSRLRGLGVADGFLAEPLEPGELLAMVESVLRRRRTDQTLFERNKMEAMSRLAGGIAHDFNNLLTVVVGYAKLSLEEVDADSTVGRNLTAIHQAGEECAALTHQLLAFGQCQVTRPVEIHLDALVAELARPLQRALGSQVELVLELGCAECAVMADPAQIEQALLLLAINARDAILGSGRVTIRTEGVELDANACRPYIHLEPGPHLRLSMVDTGIGMDPATQARAFDPFFTTKGLGRGTGLGLATVLGLVQQNAGGIGVESQVDRGSTLNVYLPRIPSTAVPAPPVVEAAASPSAGTLLIVEDEPMVRSFVKSVLKAKGFTVHTAIDGVEALEVFKQHRGAIELVLSDVVMPRMDGLQLVESLVKIAPQVPITLMSGYPKAGESTPGSTLVTRPMLIKPFTHRQLLEHVRTNLAKAPTKLV